MIRIYGSSDDLCEVEGVDISTTEGDANRGSGASLAGARDEIDCYERAVCFVIGTQEASPGNNAEGCRVWLHYAPGAPWPCEEGVWAVTILPLDEDAGCPWPIRVSFEGYTAIAEIDAPDSVPVSYEKTKVDKP